MKKKPGSKILGEMASDRRRAANTKDEPGIYFKQQNVRSIQNRKKKRICLFKRIKTVMRIYQRTQDPHERAPDDQS